MKAIVAAFVALLATLCPLVAQSQKPMALVGGMLIDGTGAPPVRDSVVLIRGDRIERVGTMASLPVPSEYERISTEGMTVLPGLWDLHVHLIYSGHPNPGAWFRHAADFERVTIPASARQMLMGGVTSVRDLAAPADAIFAVKKRIASGELPGPTLYAAGPALAKMAPGQPAPTSQFLPIRGCGRRARQDTTVARCRRRHHQDLLRGAHVSGGAERHHHRGARPGPQDRGARPDR